MTDKSDVALVAEAVAFVARLVPGTRILIVYANGTQEVSVTIQA